MTKLVYRGIEFDTAAQKANAGKAAGKTDLVYRGYKNDDAKTAIAAPGATVRNPNMTYRGFRVL